VRDEIEKLKQAGIQAFGVNPAGVDSHRAYVEKMRFNFPLLSDADRAIARAYAALKDDGKGIQRTVYVIGRDGREGGTVRFAQRGAPPVDDIVKAVGEGNRGR
jgi:peroxiredoxin Q/BCP